METSLIRLLFNFVLPTQNLYLGLRCSPQRLSAVLIAQKPDWSVTHRCGACNGFSLGLFLQPRPRRCLDLGGISQSTSFLFVKMNRRSVLAVSAWFCIVGAGEVSVTEFAVDPGACECECRGTCICNRRSTGRWAATACPKP